MNIANYCDVQAAAAPSWSPFCVSQRFIPFEMYSTYEVQTARQKRAQYIRLGLGLWAAIGAVLVVNAAITPATNLNVQTQSQVATKVASAVNFQVCP